MWLRLVAKEDFLESHSHLLRGLHCELVHFIDCFIEFKGFVMPVRERNIYRSICCHANQLLITTNGPSHQCSRPSLIVTHTSIKSTFIIIHHAVSKCYGEVASQSFSKYWRGYEYGWETMDLCGDDVHVYTFHWLASALWCEAWWAMSLYHLSDKVLDAWKLLQKAVTRCLSWWLTAKAHFWVLFISF